MTLAELVSAVAVRLDAAGVSFGHGTGNAFDEAAWLVLWRLGLPLDTPLDDPAGAVLRVTAAQQALVDELVARRITSRLPAAYLTGEAWLQGVAFHADARAIVPRSLIAELLVAGAIDAWLPAEPARVLDLCTGGGSLAILAAQHWSQAEVDASDISADALALAHSNVQRHGLPARIRLLQGDGLAAAHGRYDVVLCNPPYVHADSMRTLPPEYRAEPALALAGGPDGMHVVRALLRDVPRHLHPDGVLVLEIGHERVFFEAAFPALEAVWLETSAGEDQVCLLTAAALERRPPPPTTAGASARRQNPTP